MQLPLRERIWVPGPGSEAGNFANLPQWLGDVAQPLSPVRGD